MTIKERVWSAVWCSEYERRRKVYREGRSFNVAVKSSHDAIDAAAVADNVIETVFSSNELPTPDEVRSTIKSELDKLKVWDA